MKKYNNILVYKPSGADVVHGPEGIPNSQDLFMLGIQTQRQLDKIKEHSGTILIVDETHGTNPYKNQLLTCLVVDNNRRGWPVADLITSKSDAETLRFFFQTIKVILFLCHY